MRQTNLSESPASDAHKASEQTAHKQKCEARRLTALRDLNILDSVTENCYDTITQIAAHTLRADLASLTFVDETRVWAKSVCGGHLREFPRAHSLSGRVIQDGAPVVVLDILKDIHPAGYSELCKDRPLRFFAGVPVLTKAGEVVGVLCVGSDQPRQQITPDDLGMLQNLSKLITDQLDLRHLRAHRKAHHGLNLVVEQPESASDHEHAADSPIWPLPEDMRRALDLEEFVLFYQPEVEIATRRIVGLEALIRWRHPQRGLLAPMSFIPQAEKNGLILPIGDWGMGEACRQLQKWQKNRPWIDSIRVCVNLSARQFSRTGLVDHVESLLLQTNLSGYHLGLEMTESSLTPSMHTAVDVLSNLRRLGVSLHMDDFGTGYSSLSYLHQFEFDVIKIDRSFIQRMNNGDQALQIVQTIVELARVLGMDAVAEGIETEEQLALLLRMGCRFGQGYLFAPPLPADQIEEWLSNPDRCISPLISEPDSSRFRPAEGKATGTQFYAEKLTA